MKNIITLSGLDGSGKTTQLEQLRKYNGFVYTAKRIVDHELFPKLEGEKLASWWFREGSTEGVIGTIYSTLYDRNKDLQEQDFPIMIANRDDTMFDAVCASTIAVREGCQLGEAVSSAREIKSNFDFRNLPRRKILYSVGKRLDESSEELYERSDNSSYSTESEKTYRKYRRFMTRLLGQHIQDQEYTDIIDPFEDPENIFMKTQQVVNESLADSLDLNAIRFVVGLGGLSECGKSSIGLYLDDKRGINRIKIKHLMEKLELRYGADQFPFEEGIYGIGKEVMTALFSERLSEYFSERGISTAAIESLHNFEFTRNLKLSMGEKLRVVYVDTPREIRILRNSKNFNGDLRESEREVNRKDKIKLSRGAAKIKGIADLVIDNSKSFEKTIDKLEDFLGI